MRIFDQAGENIVNAELIDEDVLLNATDITFTNTATGRIDGDFTFGVGGSTLINEASGYIGFDNPIDAILLVALQGSDGTDTVFNSGTIRGRIDLAGGDDFFRQAGSPSTFETNISGGDGVDTFEVEASLGSFNARGLEGFEILSIQNGGIYSEFDGFTQISGPIDSDELTTLRSSDSPLADLSFGGSWWELDRVTLLSVTSSDGSDRVDLRGGSIIANAIDLGAGDDILSLDASTAAASAVPSIDGGAGANDELRVFAREDFSDDLANASGFEHLIVESSPGSPFTDTTTRVELSNVTGFETISAFGFTDLGIGASSHKFSVVLVSGDLSSTVYQNSQAASEDIDPLQSSLEIAAGVTLGAFTYAAELSAQDRGLTQGDAEQSFTLANSGTILGDAVLGLGDDT